MGAGLPQQPILPRQPLSWDNPVELRAWGEGLQAAVSRLYFVLAYALNGATDAGVAADRPATPPYDGAIFYMTDTDHLSVGSAGTWIEVT